MSYQNQFFFWGGRVSKQDRCLAIGKLHLSDSMEIQHTKRMDVIFHADRDVSENVVYVAKNKTMMTK